AALAVVAFYLCTTKAVAAYYVGISALILVALHRRDARAWGLLLATAVSIAAARASGLTFDYSIGSLWPVRNPYYVLLLLISFPACVGLVLLCLAPILPSPSWREASSATAPLRDATLIAVVGFLLPSIGLASLFHALIGRLATFRTVASVIPLVVIVA